MNAPELLGFVFYGILLYAAGYGAGRREARREIFDNVKRGWFWREQAGRRKA